MVTCPFNINQGTSVVLYKLGRKLGALLGVHAHDVLEKANVVGSVASLLCVQHDLVRLTSLREARDDLVGNVGAQVNGEREGHVKGPDDVTELLTTSEFVLLQPLLEQLLATLL